jgi:hypothetical protein
MIASEIRSVLETDGGATIWHDIDRSARGKDLNREAESGILSADVVIVLLTDLYQNSVNCMKEFYFAMRHGKPIIPIVLRGYRNMESGDRLPDIWWPEGLDSLSQFTPLYMVDEGQYEPVLTEAIERIHSTFYRIPRYPTSKDKVVFMKDFDTWRDCQESLLYLVRQNPIARKKVGIEDQLLAAFESIDLNKNGTIEQDELVIALNRTESQLTSEEISALMQEADINNDGRISFDEFKGAMLHIFAESGHNLRGSFILADIVAPTANGNNSSSSGTHGLNSNQKPQKSAASPAGVLPSIKGSTKKALDSLSASTSSTSSASAPASASTSSASARKVPPSPSGHHGIGGVVAASHVERSASAATNTQGHGQGQSQSQTHSLRQGPDQSSQQKETRKKSAESANTVKFAAATSGTSSTSATEIQKKTK